MKRVIIDLMETQKDVEDFNRVSEQITNSPRYSELCNLFNEKYYLQTLSKKDNFGNGDTGIFLIEVKDNELYIDNNSYTKIYNTVMMFEKLGMVNRISKYERKVLLAITSLIYNLIKEKEIRTSEKTFKINLKNFKTRKENNKIMLKDYKYAKKDYQGHTYTKSDKQWKVRGHYRRIHDTLCWIDSYEKSFIL